MLAINHRGGLAGGNSGTGQTTLRKAAGHGKKAA